MRKINAWLRMMEIGGAYPFPTSEAAYTAHSGLFDLALPTHGGKLQADGSWLQEPWKLDHAWGQSLRGLASGAGQAYYPAVNSTRDNLIAVLDNPALQDVAANNLVSLAQTRFDAPWTGVFLDFEDAPLSYRDRLSGFLYLLAYKLHTAGLAVGVAVRGRTEDLPGVDYENAYLTDFATVARIADYVDLMCYCYWLPYPRSQSPYWWIDRCVEFALSKGIPPARLSIGTTLHAVYWPDSFQMQSHELTYAQAMDMTQHTQANWIENGENGLVREVKALTDTGHLWLHNADTLRHTLDLVDKYGLGGVSLFTPESGDPAIWAGLEAWKAL